MPWTPTPLATVQDRLPEILDSAEATLRTLAEIVSKVPESLDRSNRFFTNIERIVQDSELPALSADSRKFFSTTSEQIDKIATELNRVIGTDGTLVTFVEDARAAIKAADLPGTNQSARDRGGPDGAGRRRSAARIAGHSRFARSIARSRSATPGAAGVGRVWPTPSADEAMTRMPAQDRCPRRCDDLSGRNGLPVEAARDDTGPHDRAAIAGAAAQDGLPAWARPAPAHRLRSVCSIRNRAGTSAAVCFINSLMAS